MQQLRDRYASLSCRERQVMALVVSGRLNKQVGGELGITEITVKAHRGKVMQKDAGRFSCRPGENGREAPHPTRSSLSSRSRSIAAQLLRRLCGRNADTKVPIDTIVQ